jgi:hypothetical protein
MTKRTTVLAAGIWGAFMSAAMLPAAAQAQTLEGERAAHPELVRAEIHLKEAIRALEAAPGDYAGHKGVAITDARRALHSLRAALYFRLKADESQWERY